MKITGFRVVGLTAPYIRPGGNPKNPSNGVRNCVWLCLATEDGKCGWGEVYAGCYATEVCIAALQRLCSAIVGLDLLQAEHILADLRYQHRYWAMRGIGAQCTSAIEGALWDIVGQVQQKPLWALLGDGRLRPLVLYASAGDSAPVQRALRGLLRRLRRPPRPRR